MKALILNIGDELLSGKTINTNSSFIATELYKISIIVEKIVVVGDDQQAIKKEVSKFMNSDLDILITTGGMGPTHDDLSKEIVTKTLGLKLELHQESLERIEKYFENNAPKSNLKQAYFPKNSFVIKNELGTAPGVIIPHLGKHYFILVGPPNELYPMVVNDCLTYLRNLQDEETLIQEYLVMGEGESYFEDLLDDLLKNLKNVKLSPYASVGKIRFQIKARAKYKTEFLKVLTTFEVVMADYIVSKDNQEVEEVLLDLLEKHGFKVSFAESITGGMLASKFINVPGASKYLGESFITYSIEAKQKYLNVSNETIDRFGEVSEEVAREMVEGLQKITGADVAMSVTGYAGPTGEDNKIGLVYFGIMIKDEYYLLKSKFNGNREMVRTRATLFGLYKLVSLLKD